MSRAVIIAEGRTDAVLLSYFLRSYGWRHVRDADRYLPLPDRRNAAQYQYLNDKPDTRELTIVAAGGTGEIPRWLRHASGQVANEPAATRRIQRIVIYFDRDQGALDDCRSTAGQWLAGAGISLIGPLDLGVWTRGTIALKNVAPATHHAVEVLVVALPMTEQGALETFLLQGLTTQSGDKAALVQAAKSFVGAPEASRFLLAPRQLDKAALGTTLAVLSPEHVFTAMEYHLIAVDWREVELVHAAYKQLAEI